MFTARARVVYSARMKTAGMAAPCLVGFVLASVTAACSDSGGGAGGAGATSTDAATDTSTTGATTSTGALPGCGDGVLQDGEQCDDGNGASGDGCSSACVVETGFTCSGSPSACSCAPNATLAC